MIYTLMNADYAIHNDKPYVYLFARDEFGNRAIFKKKFTPYFYAPSSEVKKDAPEYIALHGERVKRIDVQLPRDVANQRSLYSKSYEANIQFPVRYLIDSGIREHFAVKNGKIYPTKSDVNVPAKTLFMDIEVVTPGDAVPDEMVGMFPIICITFGDEKENLTTFKCHNKEEEPRMIQKALAYIQEYDPDIIAGWNIAFDINYILNRAEKLKIDARIISPLKYVRSDKRHPHIAGRSVFDCLTAFKRYHHGRKFETYSLDFLVAHPEVGVGWEYVHFDYANEMNFNFVDKVVQYNRDDVQKMIRLVNKFNLISHFDSLRRLVGCPIEYSLVTTQYLDVLILRKNHGKLVLPTTSNPMKYSYTGAYVLPTKKGIFKNVVALDFSAMYPTIIRAYNLSPETYVRNHNDVREEDCFVIGPHWFKKEPRGFLPEILTELSEFRNKIKKKMYEIKKGTEEFKLLWTKQYSIKQIIAAIYGNLAYEGNRTYTPQISDSCCIKGQELVKWVINRVKSDGYDVLVADTDSVYFAVGENEDPVKIGYAYEKLINDYWKEVGRKTKMSVTPKIEFEKVYSLFLSSGKKKRYAGLKTWQAGGETNEINIMGFEFKRSDSALISREVQKTLFDIIFHKGSTREIRKYLMDLIKNFHNLPLQKIGLPAPLGMPVDGYKNPAVVKDIIYANTYLGKNFQPGAQILRFWIKSLPDGLPNSIELSSGRYKVDRIALSPDDDLEKWRDHIDWKLMLEKTIFKKIETILDALDISIGELLSGQRQTKLDTFI